MIGRSGSDAYGWARGKYYAVAPYAEDGVVSRCGKVIIYRSIYVCMGKAQSPTTVVAAAVAQQHTFIVETCLQ